ncbi:MAG TPA: aldo/keto reductase [Burkholderiales bacterium]|nr:aldo/keto reductase [Burkholderiales bacterium]
MRKLKLGNGGPEVSAMGLGCMGMSISYGEPNDEESIATIHRALDLGVNLIVTSDAYGGGVNEALVGRALKGKRDKAVIATKFGNLALAGRGGGDDAPALTGGHPDYVPRACEKSLKMLGVDVIDIYGLHRVDATVPIEDTVGAMKRLVEQGKVRYLQLSEAGPDTLRRANKVHPIVALETEYSLWSRDVERDILSTCRELGVSFMAYAPLGRGFLTATMKTLDALLPSDRRRDHPRFALENINKNSNLLKPLENIAASRKCTPAQVALAWLLAQGSNIVPIPGTKRRVYLEQNCAALDIKLTADEVKRLSDAFPLNVTAGTRYPEKQLKALGI